MRNRSFDDKKIEFVERERKHNIAILITEEIIISTQIADEVSSYFLKKAAFNQEQVKAVIQPLYRRCTMVEFSLNIFESASNLRSRYNFSFWASLIIACALAAGASVLYFEDMQDGLVVGGQLESMNPLK